MRGRRHAINFNEFSLDGRRVDPVVVEEFFHVSGNLQTKSLILFDMQFTEWIDSA